MTHKRDILYSALYKLVETYSPEVVDEAMFKINLLDLVDFIIQFEQDSLDSLEAEKEKYDSIKQ